MSKVLTFATEFPNYHPKSGHPTYFVSKVWESLTLQALDDFDFGQYKTFFPVGFEFPVTRDKVWAKNHTIRSGSRFKPGDYFSPRIWSGRPYHSKQIIIAPDILINKVWDIEIRYSKLNGKPFCVSAIIINGHLFYSWNTLAHNDGLTQDDLCYWFNKPFKGQIICWNKEINY